jgi:uncharacterized protein (TIGR02588 family)
MTERKARTTAEWITLGVSSLILVVLVILVATQIDDTKAPAAPVAEIVGEARKIDDLHHVEVTVTNRGDDTAANVQVSAELTVNGKATTADQTIDFLAGDEAEDLVFVFEDDPASGELTVAVTSFAAP